MPGAPLVLEIGPGRGALTEHLLDRAQRVVAIEVDPLMVEALQARFPAHPRLEIRHADVLATDLGQWGPCLLAGNLPYYITSPILERIFAAGMQIERAVVLVQKEVALRLTASPNSRDYGYLTVLAQTYAVPRLLFSVPPGAFHPPPKVDSAVVELTLRRPAPTTGGDAATFLHFAGLCFRHKRKTLRNNLLDSEYGAAASNDPWSNRRAEQLTVDELRQLFHRLTSSSAFIGVHRRL